MTNEPDLRYSKELISIRRAEVLRELSRGLSGADISRKLNVSRSLICLDIQFLKSQAQESLRSHIQETIPFEYQKSRQAIQDLIRRANEILENSSEDPKIALSVINTLANLHAANMNLNSEGNIIQQAYDKVSILEEIQKRAVVSTASTDEETKEKEDFQQDEEPTPIEQDKDLQEEE